MRSARAMRFDKEAQARNILWEKIQGFGEGLNEKKREIEPFTMIDLFLLIVFVSLQEKGEKGKQTEAKLLSTIKTSLQIYAGAL